MIPTEDEARALAFASGADPDADRSLRRALLAALFVLLGFAVAALVR